MGNLNLAVIIKNPGDSAQFLLEKQKQPPKFGDEAYDSYVDSNLWDLPSADLPSLEDGTRSVNALSIAESCSEEIDLKNFDLDSTLIRVSVVILHYSLSLSLSLSRVFSFAP